MSEVIWNYEILPDQSICIAGADECKGSLVIPDSIGGLPVTRIRREAFAGRRDITALTVPGSVEDIGEGAFEGCCGLESVALSQGLRTLGRNAFKGCSRLADLFIPDTVTEIGEYILEGCSALRSLTLPEKAWHALPRGVRDGGIGSPGKNKQLSVTVTLSEGEARNYLSNRLCLPSPALSWLMKSSARLRLQTGDAALDRELNRLLNSRQRSKKVKAAIALAMFAIGFLCFILLGINAFFIKNDELLWISWGGLMVFFVIPVFILSKLK